MEMKTIALLGKNYIAVVPTGLGCDGCAFKFNSDACRDAGQIMDCYDPLDIQWREVHRTLDHQPVETFTVEQISSALCKYGIVVQNEVLKHLRNAADPEYMKYLELKKKFG